MSRNDPRVDAYIAKAQPFARPILSELRRRLHAAVPGLGETIKWNVPFFLLGDEIFASMAGFKAHTKFLVWPPGGMMSGTPNSTDFTTLDELPVEGPFATMLKQRASRSGGAGPAKKAARSKVAAPKMAAPKKAAPKKTPESKAAAKKPAVKRK